jgi:hypothetical protein
MGAHTLTFSHVHEEPRKTTSVLSQQSMQVVEACRRGPGRVVIAVDPSRVSRAAWSREHSHPTHAHHVVYSWKTAVGEGHRKELVRDL